MNIRTPGIVLSLIAFCAAHLAGQGEPAHARRQLMDFGWTFHLGNEWGIGQNMAKAGTGYGPAGETFPDASWRRVDLPHDWAVELPFDSTADCAHGFKALGAGFPQNNVGWYRRTFELQPGIPGRRIWLEFDGIYRDAMVYVNGWCVGHHEGGYDSFRYDVTDVIHDGGRNVVAVRVDASQFEGWFYEGAGIYRHVWLVQTAPLAIAPDGVFVSSRFKGNVPDGHPEIHIETRLRNAGDQPADARVRWEVRAPDGSTVATTGKDARVDPAGELDLEQTTTFESPALWSPEHPNLYTLVTTVASEGRIVDRIETEFGIRTVGFDPDKGFILNGSPYVIRGTCNHQDHAGVGSALPDRLQYYRVALLKEMGCNAYRTAHNPPAPELLEACDRLGLLVMDENRLLGSDARGLERWAGQIRRDRNHPSVAIWSLANEEFSVQTTPEGRRVAASMQALVKRLDPTRPVTYNAPLGNEFSGINGVIEVRGWSYHIGPENMDAYHAAHPRQPNVGSEQGSTVGTRGIYADDPVRGYVRAYDDNAQSWSNTAEQWLSFFEPRPWLSGGFVWTGFDYRGEPTPYGWPCVNSHFGILDTCGFPKDNFWYYKSWWTREPVLHLLPHWNWSGSEGRNIDVRALSNCEEVELLLNGKSLGRQAMRRDSELKWSVAYAPGTLSARGFIGGKVVAETSVETTGAPAAVRLAPDRTIVDADGQDCSIVTVSVVDDGGRVVPLAGNRIAFTIEGAGRIAGMGNGDPSSHEADVSVGVPSIRTMPVDGWRWTKVADTYRANLPEESAAYDDSGWMPADASADSGPLGPMGRGVFRTRFTVSPEDMNAPGIELWFGKISGDGSVYLNGRRIGAGGDPSSASGYDVKALLHPGENTVAVALTTWGANGGLNRGVQLRYIGPPRPASWTRSVFNGLAQVIVRSGRQRGPIRLTASSPGLSSAEVMLHARQPAQP